MEAVECGAAALSIILSYYGRVVPLEQLRVECGVSRDGSKASNMVRAAREFGLDAKGYKKELDEVLGLPLPVIVFWHFNHFLVLEGIKGTKVYLNDPAEGPRVVSLDEFDEGYTGVVLTFAPGPGFKKGGRRPSLLAALRQRVRGAETAVLFALLAGVALVLPGLLLPVFTQVFIDKVLISRLDSWLTPLLIGLGATALLRGVLTSLQQHYLLRLETRLSVASSSRFFWHIVRLPIDFYNQRYAGEIGSRVEMNEDVAAFLAGRLAQAVIDILMIVAYAALMFAYDWQLTLVGIGAAVLLVGATLLVSRMRVDGSRRLVQEEGKATATLMGGLANIETIKASGLESDLFSRWSGYQAKYINAQQQLATITQTFLAVPPFIVGVTNVAVLSLGALHVMNGAMTMGMLVAFQTLMASFLAPVTNMVQLAGTLQDMEGTMNRLDDVERYPVAARAGAAEDGMPGGPVQLAGALEFRNVSFGYSVLEDPLIDGFSAALAPGSRVALVGPSGSGKSTVAKLVTGLYEQWDGDVLFDGESREDIPRHILTNSIALVDQDISLFAGTVRDNITLWDTTIPESQLVQACRDACIHDDIAARQGGYESTVEEGGANFSGGQRQRLEIARALVGNPRVLVLDEATSALDAATEHAVDRNLRRRGCTCLIIAHRLSTVRDADEIIVLDHGRVIERGNHESLVGAGGTYAELVRQG
jgi:NHLM bacteriocin system ABC transporter peptidase/ATP-binding protein